MRSSCQHFWKYHYLKVILKPFFMAYHKLLLVMYKYNASFWPIGVEATSIMLGVLIYGHTN